MTTGPVRRLIYVPGVRVKPPPDTHRQLFRRCVLEGVQRADPAVAAAMAAEPAALELISWSHLLYAEHRDVALDEAGIAGLLRGPPAGPEAVPQVFAMPHRLRYAAHRVADRLPFLISVLAGTTMRLNLADAHRYIADADGIGGRIRGMLASALESAWVDGASVLLMAHSFGSVIAWDTLWELSRKRAGPPRPVDLFLTLGSPLGGHYIRDRLRGAAEKGARRYPAGIRRWQNLAAIGDLTALGRRFASDFREMRELGLVGNIADRTDLVNPFFGPDGLNVHRCYGYFVNPATGGTIAGWWRAGARSRS